MEIAKRLDVNANTIYVWFRRMGFKPDRVKEPWPVKEPEIASLEAQRWELLRQADQVQKQIELAKADRLRVERVGGRGFKITKGGEQATLPVAELPLLIALLRQLEEKEKPVPAKITAA